MAHAGGSPVILALNCGSSSIKFALFDAARSPLPRRPLWAGKIDGIGSSKPKLELDGKHTCTVDSSASQPYHAALSLLRRHIAGYLGDRPIVGVAHRVVHGGRTSFEPVRVDAHVLEDLKRLIPLAPLHQPFALDAIETLLHEQPDLPQIACFDTAFHRTLPTVEKMLPLPRSAWEEGVRRYGFHGLSYQYLALVLGERHGDIARGGVVVAHLGSGASLCAMRDLQSVSTTMGFSALDGLMMGTRSGAVDPGALIYLMETGKLTVTQQGQMLYHESGLLGLSGVSSDPRVLLEREHEEPVREALALYVRCMVRELCALLGALGGLDLLTFTAGIGEHSAPLRERVCAHLGFLGLVLDPDANTAGAAVISSPSSKVRVVVEPTNEEWIAANAAAAILVH